MCSIYRDRQDRMPSDQDTYYEAFRDSQKGGALDSFRGNQQYQYGEGLGDLFRATWRIVKPILSRGAHAFLSSAGGQANAGANLKDAVSSGIGPAVMGAMGGIGDAIAARKSRQQNGNGAKRSRKGVYKHSKKAKLAGINANTYNF